MDALTRYDFSFKNLFVPLTTAKAIVIIILVGFIVYSNMLFNGFVWDDSAFILHNTEIHSIDFSKIVGPSRFNDFSNYRPIPAFYFSLLYALFVDISFFYHFLAISFHIANAILIFYVFKHFLKEKPSLFFSLVFLVHPMQVESVSYISAVASPLGFLLGITALLLSFKNVISLRRQIIIFILLTLSFLTKEVGILFLAIILLYRLLFIKKRVYPFILTGVLTILVYSYLRFVVGGVYFAKYTFASIALLTLQERVLNIPLITFYYFKTFFYPAQLFTNQQWIVKDVNASTFYLPLFFVLTIFTVMSGLLFYLFRNKRELFKPYLFFFAWFLAGLLPSLQLFPLDQTVADRWFYFPLVGLLGIIGITLSIITPRIRKAGFIVAVSVIIIISFSFRTIARNNDWYNSITLYSRDRLLQQNWTMENDLGTEYLKLKDYTRAADYISRSVEMRQCEHNVYNLGYVYELSGDLLKARQYYVTALNAPPCMSTTSTHLVNIYIRLGSVLLLLDNPTDAKKYIMSGLNYHPRSGELWTLLAISEYSLQQYSDALVAARKGHALYKHNSTQYVLDQILDKEPIDVQATLNQKR